MWYLILVVALIAAMAFWVSKKTQKPFPTREAKPADPSIETYVCEVCGEEGCTCHREDAPQG